MQGGIEWAWLMQSNTLSPSLSSLCVPAAAQRHLCQHATETASSKQTTELRAEQSNERRKEASRRSDDPQPLLRQTSEGERGSTAGRRGGHARTSEGEKGESRSLLPTMWNT
jgi:hypothetical protein